jgi:hypothetical protein
MVERLMHRTDLKNNQNINSVLQKRRIEFAKVHNILNCNWFESSEFHKAVQIDTEAMPLLESTEIVLLYV